MNAVIGNSRRDRAAFRLHTNETTLDVTLPRAAQSDDLTVAVDGQRTERFTPVANGSVRVELGEYDGERDVSVEIWYWSESSRGALTKLDFVAPQIADTRHADRIYWQVVLPTDLHLVSHDAGLASENL